MFQKIFFMNVSLIKTGMWNDGLIIIKLVSHITGVSVAWSCPSNISCRKQLCSAQQVEKYSAVIHWSSFDANIYVRQLSPLLSY